MSHSFVPCLLHALPAAKLHMLCDLMSFGSLQYLQIWQLMLTRLQTAKTPKAIRGFIHFTALFIDKEGAQKVQQSLDAVQPNLFSILLEQIWLPNLQAMHFRHTDQKVVAVAMTKVCCHALL